MHLRHRVATATTVLAATTVLLTACSSGSSDAGGSSSGGASASGSPSASVTGDITVFAAASLTGSFTTLGQQFESANPGTKVTFNFGASSTLATQITQGAPADVFASAATSNMQTVVDAKAAATPQNFVSNSGEIAVAKNNPGGVTSLADLAKSDVTVAVCQAQVPCGKLATSIFSKAGITVNPVTQEADVKSTLAKVTTGAVDAGIVYVTDVKAAGDAVEGIEIPADQNATTEYPIASLTASKNADLAKAFIAYVLSDDGQKVLTSAGFASP
ncbi:molybdate ABC transporter substrate-binding protein [Jatrophihabitans sp. YIM 134969]